MTNLPSHSQLLGGMSSAQFLAEYWQQKPLLVRAAWPAFSNPISPEELAGLACEDEVCARLVRQSKQRWQVRHGPFKETDFTRLPAKRWTVLVPDMEKHLPELRSILEPFRFIPDWRIDDLMISYAAEQGSVGPHVDEYDVFLLQGLGRRRWQINTRPVAPDNYQADSELRILQHFEAESEWILEPGDMLYLPPGVAHFGVALDDCMTYSIGFRAPSVQDMVADFCDYLIQRSAEAGRWHDPKLSPAENPGQIQPSMLNQLQTLLQQQLSFTEGELQTWFGRFITEAGTDLSPLPTAEVPTPTALADKLAQHKQWQRCSATRFAYIAQADHAITLFIDGQAYPLAKQNAWLGELLCRQVSFPNSALLPALAQVQTSTLLLEWINQGYLLAADDA